MDGCASMVERRVALRWVHRVDSSRFSMLTDPSRRPPRVSKRRGKKKKEGKKGEKWRVREGREEGGQPGTKPARQQARDDSTSQKMGEVGLPALCRRGGTGATECVAGGDKIGEVGTRRVR